MAWWGDEGARGTPWRRSYGLSRGLAGVDDPPTALIYQVRSSGTPHPRLRTLRTPAAHRPDSSVRRPHRSRRRRRRRPPRRRRSEAAREQISDLVRTTPVLTSRSLGEACGGRVLLKAENLQRTGSFKLRGALTKLATLRDAPGVVAGSAGNHAQSLAYAARARGLDCEVFMPEQASVSKVAAVRGFGGEVQLGGDSVDHCVERARERAEETGAVFVHPFDDPDVIVGQGTLGLGCSRPSRTWRRW